MTAWEYSSLGSQPSSRMIVVLQRMIRYLYEINYYNDTATFLIGCILVFATSLFVYYVQLRQTLLPPSSINLRLKVPLRLFSCYNFIKPRFDLTKMQKKKKKSFISYCTDIETQYIQKIVVTIKSSIPAPIKKHTEHVTIKTSKLRHSDYFRVYYITWNDSH